MLFVLAGFLMIRRMNRSGSSFRFWENISPEERRMNGAYRTSAKPSQRTSSYTGWVVPIPPEAPHVVQDGPPQSYFYGLAECPKCGRARQADYQRLKRCTGVWNPTTKLLERDCECGYAWAVEGKEETMAKPQGDPS